MKKIHILFTLSTLMFHVLYMKAGNNTQQDVPTYPAEVLDLTNWKITLPIETAHAGDPDEITQTELDTFKHDEYFHVNASGDGVIFKAHAGGATTSNSGYPRSELREMTNGGTTLASWSSGDGQYHVLFIDLKINHYPDVKKHVVVGQIHDASDDIIMIRLETKKLFLEFNGTDGPTLTTDYNLGTRITVKLVTYQNQTFCYFNDVLFYTYNKSFSGAYFKAGMYTQSSCQGSKQVVGELCTAYGESEIFDVWTYHGASLPSGLRVQKAEELQMRLAGRLLFIEGLPAQAEQMSVAVIDMLGKVVAHGMTELNSTSYNLNLGTSLPTGIYNVQIIGAGFDRTKKIVVE